MDETRNEPAILTESMGGFLWRPEQRVGVGAFTADDRRAHEDALRNSAVAGCRCDVAWRADARSIGAAGCAQDDDLPGRVGRVAEFAGQILLSPQDRPEAWEPIGINYPITSGINLWVSGDGRAEVDYGGGQFRLAGDTNACGASRRPGSSRSSSRKDG
jgi:hypothetical protein